LSVATGAIGAGGLVNAPAPRWSGQLSLSYSLDPFRFNWTTRYISSGDMFADMIACASGCPTPVPAGKRTVDSNFVPAYYATDVAFSYANNSLNGNGLGEQRDLARRYSSVYTKPDITTNRAPFVNVTVRHAATARVQTRGHVVIPAIINWCCPAAGQHCRRIKHASNRAAASIEQLIHIAMFSQERNAQCPIEVVFDAPGIDDVDAIQTRPFQVET
jgi:hypothetical protein